MELLERKTYLDELDGLLRQATTGSGRLLFLGGEAGVGKSALVRTFADQVRPTTRVLTGSCDPLSTPRPLGPLLDIAEQTDGGVNWQAQASNQRVPIFSTFLAELGRKPSLVIIEDAHWADEATLDLLRYLGRRISAAPALLIVTYRDDEVGVGHPLRRVLGDLATAEAVRRLALRPLSLDGVTELAKGGGVDPTDLYRQTGGNPFFVTEVLALGGAGVPSTVRDAVLARTSRLSPAGKQALGVSAVIGSPVEPWLLERLEVNGGAVSECVDRGILIEAGPNLAFRHELGRQAVLDAISPIARVESHSRVLAALRDAPLQDLARLAHHAEQAGNREAVLEYAPAAAARAATLRSHREAAAQYARALRFAHDLPPERRGDLLEALSYECYLTDQPMEAVAACESAVGIWRKAGNRLREGDAERKLSRLLWVSGRALEAQEAGLKAIRILEELPQGSELAMAYSNLSQLCMVAWQSDEAIHWGEKAIALAEQTGEIGTLVHALNNVGAARTHLDDEREARELERSLALAIEHGLEDDAARAFANLSWSYIERYRFAQADPYLDKGIVYCAEHDLDFWRLYHLSMRAHFLQFRGKWADAIALVKSVLATFGISAVSRVLALSALGRVYARQGNSDAMGVLDKALELALQIGGLQRVGLVRSARAEAAWLSGDLDGTLAEASAEFEMAVLRDHRWLVGILAFWRWRAGELTEPPDSAFEPFALQIAGNWRDAAARWQALGASYETASALADSDGEAELRYALSEFTRLGAQPMAARVARKLRSLGATSIARGPRLATRAHPSGLTGREAEVMRLMADGMTNAQIAEVMFVSTRTIEHHVSSILTKLNANSRHEAVARYRRTRA